MPSPSLEERLSSAESDLAELRALYRHLLRELQVRGIEVPESKASNPRRIPMSEEGLALHYRQAASRARAGKQVGPGKGRVNSHAVKDRLRRAANRIEKEEAE
jgi:hypothetical protein